MAKVIRKISQELAKSRYANIQRLLQSIEARRKAVLLKLAELQEQCPHRNSTSEGSGLEYSFKCHDCGYAI